MDLEGLVALYLDDPPIRPFGGHAASREPMVVYEAGGEALKLRVPGARPIDSVLAAMGDVTLRDCDAFGAVFEGAVMLGEDRFDPTNEFDPRVRSGIVVMMFDATGVHYAAAFQGVNDDGSDGNWQVIAIDQCNHSPDAREADRMLVLWTNRQSRPPRVLRRRLP